MAFFVLLFSLSPGGFLRAIHIRVCARVCVRVSTHCRILLGGCPPTSCPPPTSESGQTPRRLGAASTTKSPSGPLWEPRGNIFGGLSGSDFMRGLNQGPSGSTGRSCGQCVKVLCKDVCFWPKKPIHPPERSAQRCFRERLKDGPRGPKCTTEAASVLGNQGVGQVNWGAFLQQSVT